MINIQTCQKSVYKLRHKDSKTQKKKELEQKNEKQWYICANKGMEINGMNIQLRMKWKEMEIKKMNEKQNKEKSKNGDKTIKQ